MGKIAVHEFTTLDGVIDEPTWTRDYGFDPRMGETIAAVMGSAAGLLLGRRTFEMFAASWSGRTAEDDPGAPFMNESPKYVVSSSPQGATWNNSTVIGPYERDAIQSLKDKVDGSLYVSGSATLVQAMLADGLVDELHLFLYPLALGSGQKLFLDGAKAKFTLARSEAYDNGVVYLGYQYAG